MQSAHIEYLLDGRPEAADGELDLWRPRRRARPGSRRGCRRSRCNPEREIGRHFGIPSTAARNAASRASAALAIGAAGTPTTHHPDLVSSLTWIIDFSTSPILALVAARRASHAQQVPPVVALVMQVAHDAAHEVNSQPVAAFRQRCVNIGEWRCGRVERTSAIAILHFHAIRRTAQTSHERRPARPRSHRAGPC